MSENLYNTSSGVNFQNPIVATDSFQSEISGQTGVLNWESLSLPNLFSGLTRTGVQWQGQLNEMIKSQNNGQELSWLTSDISQSAENARDARARVNAALATIGNALNSDTFQVDPNTLATPAPGSSGQSMTMLQYLKYVAARTATPGNVATFQANLDASYPYSSIPERLDIDNSDPKTLNDIMSLLETVFYEGSNVRTTFTSNNPATIQFNDMLPQFKALKVAFETFSNHVEVDSVRIYRGALHDFKQSQNELWDAFLFSLFDVDVANAGNLSQERIDNYNTGNRGDMILSFQTETNNDGNVIHRPVIRFASHVTRERRILLHRTMTASGIAQEYNFSRNGAIYNQSSINSETYSDPTGQNAYGGEGNDIYHFLELSVSSSGAATYAFQPSSTETATDRFFNRLYNDVPGQLGSLRNQNHAEINTNSAFFAGLTSGNSTFSFGSFLNTLNDQIATMDQADIATLTKDVQLLAMLKSLMELTESYVSVVHKFLAKKAQQQASS